MTAPLPGGGRRAIVALRAAIEKGLVEAPKPVEYAPPPVTQAVPFNPSTKHNTAYFKDPSRKAADEHPHIQIVPQPLAETPAAVVEPEAEPEKRKGGRPKLAGDPAYRRAKPFPHAVIDDFLPDDMAEEAFLAFPNADDPIWREHGKDFSGDGHARKMHMGKRDAMPEALQRVVDLVNSPAAIDKLKALTGFDDLMPDPDLYGGGITLMPAGGYLDRHLDFNFAQHLGAYRTLNLIVYLNPGWQEGDGGELELWADGKCAKRIEPLQNRAVIFTTTDQALHGVAPCVKDRRALNFYFYRKEAAPGISPEPHKTKWAD